MLASHRPVASRVATGLRQYQKSLNSDLRRFSSNPNIYTRYNITIQQSSLRPSVLRNVRKPLHLTVPLLVRNKSTAPEILSDAQVDPSAIFDPSKATSGVSPSSLNSFSDNLISDAPASAPLSEYTNGYLHSIGIDHGWGPTSTMQWFLEHVHTLSGLEWAPTIILSAVLFRMITFPVFRMTSDNGARLRELTPHMMELNTTLREATASGDGHAAALARTEMLNRYKAAKAKPAKSLVTFALIPFSYGSFVLLRHMCTHPVPALETQGFLWLTDLSSADPLCVLPLISALGLAATFRLGGEAGVAMPISTNMKKFMQYGLPTFSFFFMMFQPAGVTLHFATISLISYLQALAFRNETFRALVNIYPFKPIGNRSEAPAHETVKTMRLAVSAKREMKSQQELTDARLKQAQAGGGIAGLLNAYGGGSSGSVMQSSKDRQAQRNKERQHELYEKKAAEQDAKMAGRRRKLKRG